ncbi:hypothetical protein [Paraburkholderia kirstenboschensis]|uniref:Uncharacterized protein n=1 Tax=Paraburkholderia kirstenboschensis TaxID=1245436 RepID=A0ABZ0EDY4_9BURK|nr:hypothetical protein [Paraburkholderia kirstenboschensis]WOD14393.1 hypothetical protein RW095_02610 [Paraburkholderia kirstenboschensis]
MPQFVRGFFEDESFDIGKTRRLGREEAVMPELHSLPTFAQLFQQFFLEHLMQQPNATGHLSAWHSTILMRR